MKGGNLFHWRDYGCGWLLPTWLSRHLGIVFLICRHLTTKITPCSQCFGNWTLFRLIIRLGSGTSRNCFGLHFSLLFYQTLLELVHSDSRRRSTSHIQSRFSTCNIVLQRIGRHPVLGLRLAKVAKNIFELGFVRPTLLTDLRSRLKICAKVMSAGHRRFDLWLRRNRRGRHGWRLFQSWERLLLLCG